MICRKVNSETGMFIEDVEIASIPLLSDGSRDPSYISTPVPDDAGFYWPRWDFMSHIWVEGLTQSEISAIHETETTVVKTPDEKIADIESKLSEIEERLSEIV